MLKDFLRWFLLPFAIGYVLGFVSLAHGQGVGQDLLALQHPRFPVRDLLPLVPDEFIGGNLDWTFGEKLTKVKRVLGTKKVAKWRVHFYNGPGLRNGQLGPYEPHHGHTVKSFNAAWEKGGRGKLHAHLRDRVKLYCAMFDEYPDVSLEMSPTLEHNLTHRAFKQQARVIKRNCPRAVIVDNPVAGVPSTRGFKIERHGTAVRGLRAPCNVSLDGSEAFDANIPAFLAANKGCTKFIWGHVYNGRALKGDFVDPRKRTRWPTKQQLRTLFEYARPLPHMPFVEGCSAVERPRLFKPSAEDHANGDVRSNKPLWISPYKGAAVDVYAAIGGKHVATLLYYAPFEGGGHRYYSGTGSNLYGIEMAERALGLSGSPYVVLVEGIGGRCLGPLHPAYRHGTFRP